MPKSVGGAIADEAGKSFGEQLRGALMECYFCDQRTDLMPERPITRIEVVYDDVEEKYEAAFLADDAASQAVGRCPPSPVKTAPVQASPVKAAPVKASPVKTAPVHASPVKTAPVQASPVKTAPVQASPVKAAPASPVKVAPAPAEPEPASAGRSV